MKTSVVKLKKYFAWSSGVFFLVISHCLPADLLFRLLCVTHVWMPFYMHMQDSIFFTLHHYFVQLLHIFLPFFRQSCGTKMKIVVMVKQTAGFGRWVGHKKSCGWVHKIASLFPFSIYAHVIKAQIDSPIKCKLQNIRYLFKKCEMQHRQLKP